MTNPNKLCGASLICTASRRLRRTREELNDFTGAQGAERHRFSDVARLLAVCIWGLIFAGSPSLAAPYPKDGEPITWNQPDGTELELSVFGDEFYARTATAEGHTVVYNSADMTYYYAVLSEDGTSLVPGEHKVGGPPPVGLPQHLCLPAAAAKAIWEERHAELAPNEYEEWGEQVQARRAAEAGPPEGDAGATGAAQPGPDFVPVSGNFVGLTILVQFPDDPATVGTNDPTNFPATQAKIVRYSNELGYNDDGNTGSIRDYFLDQSLNTVDYTQDVTQIVTLPEPRNYYNFLDYPANTTLRDGGLTGRLVLGDAIAELQTAAFDFTQVSLNGSDRVVATNVLFAGPTSGVWPDGLWPHRWSIPQINVGTAQDPIYIYDYQITNAANSAVKIGTFIHENGHLLLKYPDIYDTNSGNGASEGVGEHCLMGSGNHLNGGRTPAPINGYFKDISGWSNVVDITPTQFLVGTLPTTGNEGYRIRKPGTATEYFFIENRGAGDPWAANAKDKGILIWHIDETVNGNQNQQMTASQHYEVSVEQADGDFDLENGSNRGDNGDLFDSTTQAFTDTSLPDAKWWDGSDSSVIIDVLDTPGATMDVSFGSLLPEIAVEHPASNDLADGVSSIRFGASGIGVPIAKTFTIRNIGNSDLTGLALTIDGAGSSDFSATALGQTVLVSGASLTFDVTYTPSVAAATAALHVASSDSNENPFDIDLVGVVRGLIVAEGFEGGLGGWTDSAGNDFDWTRKSGSTTSNGTGPSGASTGSWYLYTEASGQDSGYPSKTAAIEKEFDLTGLINTSLFFDYHMYGAAMGTLFLDVHDGSSWQEGIWSLSGEQQGSVDDPWRQAEVDLSDYNNTPGVRLRFRGVTGSSFTSDMSIDEVELHGLLAEYELSYTAGTGGSINGSALQSVSHGSDGTLVEAIPDTNYRFVDWSDSSTDNPRTDLAVTAAISVTANFAQNFPPTFSGYTIGVDEEDAAVVSLGKLLVGVTDPEGHTFSVTSAGPASAQGGTVTLGLNSITYNAPLGVNGSDSFQVTVTDQFGGEATAPVTVTIRPAAGTAGSSGRNPATVTMNASSDAEVRFHGIPGRQYRIQRSTDLVNWQDIGTVTAAANGELFHTDVNPPQPSAYYRLAR